MPLRRAVTGLFKRFRYRYQAVIATPLRTTSSLPNAGKMNYSCQYYSGGQSWNRYQGAFRWIFLSGQAVLFFGLNTSPVLAEDVSVDFNSENDANLAGLVKAEDGSVVSNIHTSKWRVFTDAGRDRFLQGKLEDAERLFQAALREAKEGFGERDPHVASACNNLAELYRIQKAFDKAEPLYLEAINVLEETLGSDDIRVGAAVHNIGQFYLVQRKLEEASVCYERALKIKRHVLGEAHTDYADTMYHLGTVLYLQGKVKDSEALVLGSIRILENAVQGESIICIRRLRYLAQIYSKSHRPADAENIQRKIFHMIELSKGWNSLDTVIAAEGLALTLQSVGSLRESQELLERCLKARRTLLSEDHIQIAANLLHLGRVEMLNSDQLKKASSSEAIAELDKAKDHLGNAIRIAQQVLDKLTREDRKKKSKGIPSVTRKYGHAALVILLQSLNTLGMLEITKVELQGSREDLTPVRDAEQTLHQCISAFKEFGTGGLLSSSNEAKAEYLSCLKHLSALLSNSQTESRSRPTLQELKDVIKSVEGELSANGARFDSSRN